MNISNDEFLERLRERQRTIQPQYHRLTPAGRAVEITWQGQMPVNVLINAPKKSDGHPHPVFLHMHGGGFVEGDAVTMDSFCQKLADSLNILVVNVNYKLFPDYCFPYQIEEIEAVYEYILSNQKKLQADVSRIGIGGFSAGATLALGTVLKAVGEGTHNYACCVCGYPMTSAFEKDQDAGSKFPATDEQMMQAIELFFNGQQADPKASALLAPDELLKKLRGVILLTCGRDSLGAQGRRFAKRLIDCGVPLCFREFENAYHGFIEVNRPDYFEDDTRKTPEQQALTDEAEEFIIGGLSRMLCL